MPASPEYYESILNESGIDTESLTVVTVAGADLVRVAETMDIDLSQPVDPNDLDDGTSSAYALLEVPGGVVAIERMGYADPTISAITQMSEGGQAAAVVRSNIQAHYRFGCARAGQVLFDDDEYVYIDNIDRVPCELRDLFTLAWDDLDTDIDAKTWVDPVAVGLAMGEVVTGIELTAANLSDLASGPWYRAPNLVYRPESVEPVWPAEREPGLVAARAVLADLTGAPGARRLSGALGDLVVEMEFAGTRTRLFNRVGRVAGWPPTMGGIGVSGLEVGNEYFTDATLPDFDGTYAMHGATRTKIVEISKPRRLVKTWNWLIPGPDGSPYLRHHQPLLEHDAVLTIDFIKANSSGEEATTLVRLQLAGIPIEWEDDFRALWTWDAVRFASSA
jgi:hypothetical protein